MAQVAVLDDNTRDANVIGYASNQAEAADVYRAYCAERMDADDLADLTIPTFAYRTTTSVASPAYEPL